MFSKNDRLVDWRNHTWRVVNPVRQTIVGCTGGTDGQRRYYRIEDGRAVVSGDFADHYPARQVEAAE